MKKIFTLFLLISIPIYSHALVSFENFFQKPNSDYFYTCSGGYNSCGSWLGEQYQLLFNELQTISGEYSISIELYEYLNQLDNKRTNIINDISQKFDAITTEIGEEEQKYTLNCKKYIDYLGSSSKKCLDYEDSEDFQLNQINSISSDLAIALDEYTLTIEQVDKIQNIGNSFTNLLNGFKSDLILLNASLIKEIAESPNYVAEQNRIAEEKRLIEEKQLAEKTRLAEERRIAEEKRVAEENRIVKEKQEALDEENRIANLPENLLVEGYGYYILIKELYEGDYLYITPRQMTEAKEQMRLIQDILANKANLDTDSLWGYAVEQYEANYSSLVDIFHLTYTSKADAFASIATLSLGDLAKKIGVKNSIKQDF